MLHVGSSAFQSGGRRYPVSFDWLLPAGTYVPVRCPSCDGEAPLVAGKPKLGCETPAVRTSSRRNFGPNGPPSRPGTLRTPFEPGVSPVGLPPKKPAQLGIQLRLAFPRKRFSRSRRPPAGRP